MKKEENITEDYAKKIIEDRILMKPNCINKKILRELKKNKVKIIELEVQSTNDFILEKSNIEYTFKDVKKASKLIKLYRFKLGYQMMVGLPESTREDEINTAKELIKLKPKIVRINPVMVIKGTKLEKDYEDEKYQALTITQAVEICKILVNMFEKKKIKDITIGLQNADEIDDLDEEDKIIAGPFHPEFLKLVESSIWYDRIVEQIKKLNTKVKEVEVAVNPKEIDDVIGYKKENILKLKEIYEVDLIVKQNNKMKPGKCKIEVTKTYNDR